MEADGGWSREKGRGGGEVVCSWNYGTRLHNITTSTVLVNTL